MIINKKMISFICAVTMMLTAAIPSSAYVIENEPSYADISIVQSGSYNYDDFSYDIIGDTIKIKGCSKTDSEITVPSEIDGKAVTVIGKEAFFHCNYTKITLPEGIVTIESSAFEHSPNLESVNIPSTVTTIENAAFDGVSKLTVINVPAGVTSIGDWAFHRCSKLTAINVDPSNTNYKSIDGVLFNSDGTNLIEYPCGKAENGLYNIPEGTETIQTYAFHCSKISSLTLPSTLTTIGNAAFSHSSKLESVTIPGNVKTIESDAFTSCQSLTSIIVENGVETIGDEAFSYCGKLQTVSIPQSVTSLGSGMLRFCSSLETITVDPGCLCCTVKDGVLFDKDMTTILCYPAAKADTSYTIPDGVSIIGYSAFSNCKNLTSVTIPYSITEIRASAFNNCQVLNNITIPNGVTVVAGHAFYGCSSLTDIVIPDSVTTIGTGAFYECKSLKSIKLSNNISTINGSMFSGCESLESIVIPESVTKICDRVFCYCKKLKSITLPSHLNYIEAYCFLCCSSLESITISEGVEGISYRTFYECYNLKNIELPSTITGIASEAFIYCSSLESITLPVGCKNISGNSFSGCKKLDKIVIPKSVWYIGSDAFNNSPNVNFYCCMNSYADRYAEKFGLPRVYITDLNLNKTNLDLEKGKQFTLTAEITPDSSKDQKVTWSSDKPDVVTVDNGILRAKSKGKAVITVTTEDGTYEECIVNVYVDVVHHEAVPATCTENGIIEYWLSDNKYYKDEALTEQAFDIIDYATGHNWNDPEYTWDDEYNCTAKRTCKNDPSHIEIETVKADDIVLSYPECENNGTILYTARFENTSFFEQKKEVEIPATGHNWREPQYGWQGDEIPTECEAWRVCENNYEYQTETADVAYRVVSEPTCDGEGIGEYYAVFKNSAFAEQIWSVTIPPKGHAWGNTTYVWSNDNKTCTATRICSVDDEHIETETVNATIEVTKNPTCEEKGEKTYTALFKNTDFKKQTKTEPIKSIGHKWGEPVWNWDGIKSVTAIFVCENDPSHVETVTTDDIHLETNDIPHCEDDINIYYYAFIDFNGKSYLGEKTVVSEKTGHNYGEPEWKWDGFSKATAEFVCGYCDKINKVDAVITSERTEPTCDSDGKAVYTATVILDDKKYTDTKTQILDKKGHKWSEPVWTWKGLTATAAFTCENDPSHVESVTTIGIMTETADCPHCDWDLPVYYEASVEFDGKYYSDEHLEMIPATGHSWGKPQWKWNGHDSATAEFLCDYCYHTLSIDAEITSVVTTEPTKESEGIRTYTAKVKLDDKEYTDKITDTIQKLTPDEPSPIGLLGDVTQDGTVDSADALAILRNSVGFEIFDETQNLLGEVTGDSTVDSADALEVLRFSVQISSNEDIGKFV